MDKKEFLDWLNSYTDAEKCFAYFNKASYFRINELKINIEEFKKRSILNYKDTILEEVKELEDKIAIGKTWEYFLGLIHPQSLSSALVAKILAPKEHEKVIDMAAAPGSKLTHASALMRNTGYIYGIDFKDQKIASLFGNITRLGVVNTSIVKGDSVKIKLKDYDKAIVDVPCTSLGSGPSAYLRWDPSHSKKISILQKKMLLRAFDNLKEGGILTYSTCTYSEEENEQVVKYLLENRDAKLLDLPFEFPRDKGLKEYGKEFSKVARIYPYHLNSEGFFIAKIKKVSS